MKHFLIIVVLMLFGCSLTPLSEEELERREYNRAIDAENWELCEQVYNQNGIPTIHINHSHATRIRSRGHALASHIRRDLSSHSCKFILREYWADHWTKDKKVSKRN